MGKSREGMTTRNGNGRRAGGVWAIAPLSGVSGVKRGPGGWFQRRWGLPGVGCTSAVVAEADAERHPEARGLREERQRKGRARRGRSTRARQHVGSLLRALYWTHRGRNARAARGTRLPAECGRLSLLAFPSLKGS